MTCAMRMLAAALLLIACRVASNVASHDFHNIVESDLPAEEVPKTPEASHRLLLKLLSKRTEHEMMFDVRGEFYTMATGKDYYGLVADEAENREYHAVAQAVLQLWQKLPHMAAVSAILRTALRDGVRSAHSQGDITEALPAMKATIEKLLQEPHAPNDEYKRLKAEALARAPAAADRKAFYYVIPKTKEDANKIVAQCLNEPLLKRLMVHSAFGNETRKQSASSPQTFQLARSIVELSKEVEYGAKAQALYDEAVAETAAQVEDVDAANVDAKHVRETFVQIGRKFFKTLAEKFENDATLKEKFAEKKQLLAKSR